MHMFFYDTKDESDLYSKTFIIWIAVTQILRIEWIDNERYKLRHN